MKGVLSKILRLVFVVLLIINTVPRNLYADGEETAPAEQESIVEPAADPEPDSGSVVFIPLFSACVCCITVKYMV